MLMQGFAVAGTPENLMIALIGCFIGTVVGLLPGLGPCNGVAILLPIGAALWDRKRVAVHVAGQVRVEPAIGEEQLLAQRNSTIAGMILQQALGLGLIGFVVGKVAATLWAPAFPKYVLLVPIDSILGFFAVLTICVLASIVAIRMALKVDPAEAIGG